MSSHFIILSEITQVEEWKPIIGFLGAYEVSDLGRIRSLTRLIQYETGYKRTRKGIIIKPCIQRNGYLALGLYKNKRRHHYTVHSLVATMFVPNPDNLPQINHRDRNKKNNKATNLEWMTQRQNIEHAMATGYDPSGSGNARAKLCEGDIPIILEKVAKREQSVKDIASDYQVSTGTIHKIMCGVSWKKTLSRREENR